MDYRSMALPDLRATARGRGISATGAVGRTSWVATASRDALVAALFASDAGTPLAPLAPSASDSGDAAKLFAQALAALMPAASLDESRVRAIAREESSANAIVHVLREPAPAVEVGRTHKVFKTALDVVHAGLIPYLYGPPGTGKTHLCSQIATALGLTFHGDSFNEQTPDYRIAGYRDATGAFVPTPFYRAVTEPGLYLGDEIDKASANVTGAFNLALSNGHASFACGLTPKHDGARFMFAGNTAGLGATPQYPDRNVLPADFRDRFVFLPMPVDSDLERALALAHNPDAGDWVTFVQVVRERVEQSALPLSITPRASISGARLLALGWKRDAVEQAVLWRHAPDVVITRARGK